MTNNRFIPKEDNYASAPFGIKLTKLLAPGSGKKTTEYLWFPDKKKRDVQYEYIKANAKIGGAYPLVLKLKKVKGE